MAMMLVIILCFLSSPSQNRKSSVLLHRFPCRIGMARMDTVDLSSGSEVYTPDVEEASLFVSSASLVKK